MDKALISNPLIQSLVDHLGQGGSRREADSLRTLLILDANETQALMAQIQEAHRVHTQSAVADAVAAARTEMEGELQRIRQDADARVAEAVARAVELEGVRAADAADDLATTASGD